MKSKYKTISLIFLILLSFSNLGTYIKKELNTSGSSDTGNSDTDEEQSRPPEVRKYNIVSPQQLIIPDQQQSQRETQLLREEVSNLRKELSAQKDILNKQNDLTSTLLDRVSQLSDAQSNLIADLMDTTLLIKDISLFTMTFIPNQFKYKDAFILNSTGQPYAYIDPVTLKIYEYNNGNLLGWINSDTNEITRNIDSAIIAVIEGDFLLDQTGRAIGSIERSETLKWDREKLYSMVQKTLVSHFFVRPNTPLQFILSPYRSSNWSDQKLENVLFFSEKNIQKLK